MIVALFAALFAALALCGAVKHTEDPYDNTFLRHRSFKREEHIRSTVPFTNIVDGRDTSSFVDSSVPYSYESIKLLTIIFLKGSSTL